MNDFTKKELETIQACMDENGDHYCCGQTAYEDLADKLQSMINDCERINPNCSHHEIVRLKLHSGKEFDFCETCLFIKRMR